MKMTSLWQGTSLFLSFFFNSQSAQHILIESMKEWLFCLVQMPLRVLHVTGRLDSSVVIWENVYMVSWGEWDFRA